MPPLSSLIVYLFAFLIFSMPLPLILSRNRHLLELLSVHSRRPQALITALYYSPLLLSLIAAPFSRKARYYLRSIAFLLSLGLLSVYGLALGCILPLLGKRKSIHYVIARSFYYWQRPFTGMSFKVQGEEHILRQSKIGPAVYVGNHQSMIDIAYLGRIFPQSCSIMSKQELRYAPLLGQYMSLAHTVWINRNDRKDAVATFGKVAEEMKSKQLSLFIFAEGTRSSSPSPALLPFKRGAFHLAIQAQVPIIPIVCGNYHACYSTRRRWFEAGTVPIHVLEPIRTEGMSPTSEDVGKLLEETRKRMGEEIVKMAVVGGRGGVDGEGGKRLKDGYSALLEGERLGEKMAEKRRAKKDVKAVKAE